MGEKKRHNARFFSPKDLYIFCSTEDTIQNRRLFFYEQFSRQKT